MEITAYAMPTMLYGYDSGPLDIAAAEAPKSFANSTEAQQATKVFVTAILIMQPFIVVGNIFVFFAIALYPGFHSTHNYPLMSLSVADFTMGVFTIPMYSTALTPSTAHHIKDNKYLCLFWCSSIMVSGGGSLYNLLFIATERFIGIKYPLKYKTLFSGNRFFFFIILIWIYVIFLAFCFWLPGWNYYRKGNCNFYTTLPVWYVYWGSFGTVSITLSLSTIMYVIIFLEIRKVIRKNANVPLSFEKAKEIRDKVTGVKVTGALTTLFIALWLPYVLVAPFKYYSGVDQGLIEAIKVITQILNFSNSGWNILIYSLARPEYRKVVTLMATNLPWNWKQVLHRYYRHRCMKLIEASRISRRQKQELDSIFLQRSTQADDGGTKRKSRRSSFGFFPTSKFRRAGSFVVDTDKEFPTRRSFYVRQSTLFGSSDVDRYIKIHVDTKTATRKSIIVVDTHKAARPKKAVIQEPQVRVSGSRKHGRLTGDQTQTSALVNFAGTNKLEVKASKSTSIN